MIRTNLHSVLVTWLSEQNFIDGYDLAFLKNCQDYLFGLVTFKLVDEADRQLVLVGG